MSIFSCPNFFLIFIICFIKGTLQLRNVKLILPPIVQAGKSATLLCLYDLEDAPLYSVQWYRGQFEFFRFLPSEKPPTKVFEIPGIYVDTFASNEHQVTLKNIPVQISGEFSCEITTEAPPFSTSCMSNNMTVIDFKLHLSVPKREYRFGDIINANCTLTPKLPSTKLVFHWNGKPISDRFISHNFSNSAILHLNSSFFDKNISFSLVVQLRCSTLLDDVLYIVSKSVFLKLQPATSSSCSGNAQPIHVVILSFTFFIYKELKNF